MRKVEEKSISKRIQEEAQALFVPALSVPDTR
jgi:hypothetical protein